MDRFINNLHIFSSENPFIGNPFQYDSDISQPSRYYGGANLLAPTSFSDNSLPQLTGYKAWTRRNSHTYFNKKRPYFIFYTKNTLGETRIQNWCHFLKFRITVDKDHMNKAHKLFFKIIESLHDDLNPAVFFKISVQGNSQLTDTTTRLLSGGQFTLYAKKDITIISYIQLLAKVESALKMGMIKPGIMPPEDFPLGNYVSIRLELDPTLPFLVKPGDKYLDAENNDTLEKVKYYYAHSQMIKSCKKQFDLYMYQALRAQYLNDNYGEMLNYSHNQDLMEGGFF